MKLLVELLEDLKKLDEITLLEILDISSEDIVEKFIDEIDDKYDELIEKFEDKQAD